MRTDHRCTVATFANREERDPCVVHEGPTVTEEAYNPAVRTLAGKDRLESPADWPVEGLILHTAGQGANGFRIVDVWESEDAFRRFGEAPLPVLGEIGITDEPEVYQPVRYV
jgi:hypothetical protein